MTTSSYIITAENLVQLVEKANYLLKTGQAKFIAHASFCKNKGATATAYCQVPL